MRKGPSSVERADAHDAKIQAVVRLSINHYQSTLSVYDIMPTCNLMQKILERASFILLVIGKALSAMQITKFHHVFLSVVITATVSAGFTYILVAYQWQSQPLLTAVAKKRKEAEGPEVA